MWRDVTNLRRKILKMKMWVMDGRGGIFVYSFITGVFSGGGNGGFCIFWRVGVGGGGGAGESRR